MFSNSEIPGHVHLDVGRKLWTTLVMEIFMAQTELASRLEE